MNLKNIIRNLFVSKETRTITELYERFLSGDGLKKLMDLQQEAFYREKNLERIRLIKEKYEFYRFKEFEGLPMNVEEKADFEYVTFWMKKKKK